MKRLKLQEPGAEEAAARLASLALRECWELNKGLNKDLLAIGAAILLDKALCMVVEDEPEDSQAATADLREVRREIYAPHQETLEDAEGPGTGEAAEKIFV